MNPPCYGNCDKDYPVCKSCAVFVSCGIISLTKRKEKFEQPLYVPEALKILGKKTAVECAKQVILEHRIKDEVFSYSSLRNRFIITCRINGVNPGNIDRNIRKAVELLNKAGKIMHHGRNQWKVMG